MGETLVIWTETGSTLYFEQVENFNQQDNAIFFSYFGVSTQVKRVARFNLNKIAGYAIQ